jgi:hypothetical protein
MNWMNFLNAISKSEELFVVFTVSLPQTCIIVMITFFIYNAAYMQLQYVENAEEKKSSEHILLKIMFLVNAILMLVVIIYPIDQIEWHSNILDSPSIKSFVKSMSILFTIIFYVLNYSLMKWIRRIKPKMRTMIIIMLLLALIAFILPILSL